MSRAHSISRRTLLGGALAAGLGVAGLAQASPASAADGLQIVSSWREGDRDLVALLRSTAVSKDLRLRILLPTGYDANPQRHYPTLYLLHGSTGDCDSYTDNTSLRDLTAGMDVVVVLPDGGKGSWYSNHPHSSLAPMDWETFHVGQLIDAVDANVRTLAWGSARGIAGFSCGGYGAVMYAGRYPWLFGAVSSYSGPLDAFDMEWRKEMSWEPTYDGEAAGAIYGTEPGAEAYSDLVDRNPSTYASKLVDHRVRLSAGDGSSYELQLRSSTNVFRQALVDAGAWNLDWQEMWGASHDMANAERALQWDLPGLVASLDPARTY